MTNVFAVVGLGSMGKRRVRDLMALNAGRVIGVDRREDRRTEVEQRFKVTTTDDLDRALALKPKAVLVCVPPHLHYNVCVQALEAGTSYFVECLTALTREEMDDLVARDRVTPGRSFTSCTHLLLESTQYARKLLADGSAGRVFSVHLSISSWLPNQHPWEKKMGDHYEFHRAQGGGLAEPAYHLSWIYKLIGQRPVSVFAKAAHLSDLPPGFNDLLDAIIEIDGGTVVNLHYTLHEQHDNSVGRFQRFACEKGTIVSDSTEARFYDAARKAWSEYRVPPGWNFESIYMAEMRHFLAALDGQDEFFGDLERERLVVQTLLAAEESSQTGRVVSIESR